MYRKLFKRLQGKRKKKIIFRNHLFLLLSWYGIIGENNKNWFKKNLEKMIMICIYVSCWKNMYTSFTRAVVVDGDGKEEKKKAC